MPFSLTAAAAALPSLKHTDMLRFPAWQRTEWGANHQRQWGSRTLPSQRQSTGRGVAIEFMIQLCNTVGAAPWFHLSQVLTTLPQLHSHR